MLDPRVVESISMMMRNIPVMLGETETLRAVRGAPPAPGMATISKPYADRNISLIKFHRDLRFEDFAAFQVEYKRQYQSFRGKFIMIFDLQWVDWTTLETRTMEAFLQMVESMRDYRPTHILGICLLLPREYDWLIITF